MHSRTHRPLNPQDKCNNGHHLSVSSIFGKDGSVTSEPALTFWNRCGYVTEVRAPFTTTVEWSLFHQTRTDYEAYCLCATGFSRPSCAIQEQGRLNIVCNAKGVVQVFYFKTSQVFALCLTVAFPHVLAHTLADLVHPSCHHHFSCTRWNERWIEWSLTAKQWNRMARIGTSMNNQWSPKEPARKQAVVSDTRKTKQGHHLSRHASNLLPWKSKTLSSAQHSGTDLSAFNCHKFHKFSRSSPPV